MKEPNGNNETDQLDAPDRLIAALRQSTREPVFVPSTLDETILRAARAHLSQEARSRFRWIPSIPWLAAATAIVIAGVFFFVSPRPARKLPNAPVLAREDLNHDGKVDILDAFALARQLKQGRISSPALDINGDGVVDERDMQVIASEAVRLDRKGQS